MLAPRKKLWSTPPEVLEKAIELLEIKSSDVVYDIGAGDGRFIIECHQRTGAKCIGIEIDEKRAEEARRDILERGLTEDQCSIIIGNALEQDYSAATVLFLYLVPRGLKLMMPMLQNIPRKLKVITYMASLPECIDIKQTVKVKTSKHADAEWPLYLYDMNGV
mmetsp:Transcript_31106/g.29683  ORF Transcript_31106/g.29683 Transcript_31106/m.29683 type:complete len:163 (+) Transcript_31106:186-674(+)|eukprot:CAMPEP_0119033172 /NCGR_PEP_ID=MMETSP1177-20130426/182_1 /TAXON_ID=2985 /ORGANISM="Ochromonas sp, Strain CCMP1899" /LENGTH=162 /DNA_ID=CAMNT_0006989701 /DNA_START=145 /DNA_END=633 /DNA_ORIENTATION=-